MLDDITKFEAGRDACQFASAFAQDLIARSAAHHHDSDWCARTNAFVAERFKAEAESRRKGRSDEWVAEWTEAALGEWQRHFHVARNIAQRTSPRPTAHAAAPVVPPPPDALPTNWRAQVAAAREHERTIAELTADRDLARQQLEAATQARAEQQASVSDEYA